MAPHAPPWPDELNDNAMRVAKRARPDTSAARRLISQSECTLRKDAVKAAIKLAKFGNWDLFVDAERGPADITAFVHIVLPHKAASHLEHLQECHDAGSTPLYTQPWSAEWIRLVAQRGSHCLVEDEVEFVCAEMLDFCDHGIWIILPWLPHYCYWTFAFHHWAFLFPSTTAAHSSLSVTIPTLASTMRLYG